MPTRPLSSPALLSPALLLIGAALAAVPARAAEEIPRAGVSVSVRAAKDRDPLAEHLQRRRRWLSALLFVVLLLLSMGITLFVSRSGVF